MKYDIHRSVLCAAIAACTLAGVARGASDDTVERALSPANFDNTAQPCDNFYQYATGGWRASHPIPPAFSRWGAFDQLADDNMNKMHKVLDRLVATPDTSDPDFPRIANYYKSCMDEDRIEREGEAWLQAQLKPIAQAKTRPAIMAEIARLQNTGITVFFGFGATADGKNSDMQDAGIDQAGLSLPNRDYYTRDDDKAKTLRTKFVAHVTKMFGLAGESDAEAAADAQAVMDVEMKLALASRTPVELRDPIRNYNLMPVSALQSLSPDFDWTSFAGAIGAPSFDQVDVGQPDFVKGMSAVLATASPESLNAYMRWHVIRSGGDALPKRFVDERFEFSKLLSGSKEQHPRWWRCLQATTGAMPDAVGKAFVKKIIPAGTKERVLVLVDNVIRTLREDIGELDWMSPETKKLAVNKLDKMTKHIAYPDKPIDYSALHLTGNEIFGDAKLAASRFSEHRDLKKIGKPTDHNEWEMSAMITNAYYAPENNSITFPAGILLPPYFDVKADDAVNYGGIGAVIGHEMTHGFDDEGRNYDEHGNLKDWWIPADAEKFNKLGQCIVDEYNSFVAVDDLHENGALEEGEAIADLGGTVISHRAFLKTAEAKAGKPIDGMTPDQRFYAAYGELWEQNLRPEQARTYALTDPHPLAQFRVMGTLGNLPDFAKAYQCKPDAPMVRAVRCKIW